MIDECMPMPTEEDMETCIPAPRKLTREEIETTFNEAKEVMLTKLEVSAKHALRIDNVMRTFSQTKDICHHGTDIRVAFEINDKVSKAIESAREALEALTFDLFIADDYDDIYKPLITYVDKPDSKSLKEWYACWNIYEAMSYYGGQLERLRFEIMNALRDSEDAKE